MSESTPPWSTDTATASAEPLRRRYGGWRRYVFPAVFLVYLAQTGVGITKHASGWGVVAGFFLLAAFCALYIVALPFAWDRSRRRWTLAFVAAVLCVVLEMPFAHEDSFVMFTFVAVLAVGGLRRNAAVVVGAIALFAAVVPRLIPSWHADYQWASAASILLVSFAMFAFFGVIQSNVALAAARAEVARLAAENERTRIARDLHDLLGHSLTTITVKAGLARRLAEHGEHDRAAGEIAEVETLSRRTLTDVRAAVAGHRDVTLAGELATAREVLRATGINAELPGSVDVVDPTLSELFGWVLRESITNVVRHSRAANCTVELGRNWIEVRDDGHGNGGGTGSGLTGIRERVDAYRGTLTIGNGRFGGWVLRVEVPTTTGETQTTGESQPTPEAQTTPETQPASGTQEASVRHTERHAQRAVND